MKNPVKKIPSTGKGRTFIDIEDIKCLYLDKRLTLRAVGERLGISRQAVHFRLKRAGISTRSNKIERPAISAKQLAKMRRLYEDERFSLNRLAKLFDTKREHILECLNNLGVQICHTNRPKFTFKYSVLFDIYVVQKQSIRSASEMLGVAQNVIIRELKRHGIKTRPQYPVIKIDRDKLYRLYVVKGMTQPSVAKIFGISTNTLRRELQRHKIKHRNKCGPRSKQRDA